MAANTTPDTSLSRRALAGVPTAVWVFTAAWIAVLASAGALRVWALSSQGFDLAFVVHGLARLAQSGPGADVPFAGWSLLEDHLSILALPLAWLAGHPLGPYALMTVEAVAVGLSIPVAWRLARRRLRSTRAAWVLTIAYATAPTLLFAAWADFYPSLLATPFFLLLIEAIEEGRGRQALLAGGVAALAREDVALLVLVTALVCVRTSPRYLGALAASATAVIMAARALAAGPQYFAALAYDYVDPAAPLATLGAAVAALWSGGRLVTLLATAALPWIGFGRTALRPLTIALLGHLPYLLAAVTTTKSPGYHYYFLVPALAYWAVLQAHRDRPLRRGVLPAGAVALALVVGPLGWGVVAPGIPTMAGVVRTATVDRVAISDAHRVLQCIPEGAVQSLDSSLVAFAGDRARVRMWPDPFGPLLIQVGDAAARLPASGDPTPPAYVMPPPDSNAAVVLPGFSYETVNPADRWQVWVRRTGAAMLLQDCLAAG